MEDKALDLVKEEIIKNFTAFCFSHEDCIDCPYFNMNQDIDSNNWFLDNRDICSIAYTLDWIKNK